MLPGITDIYNLKGHLKVESSFCVKIWVTDNAFKKG